VDRIFEDALAVLKKEGAELLDVTDFPDPRLVGEAELDVLLYEFKADLNSYLAGLGERSPMKSLTDIIDFNDRNKDREMALFGQELFIKAESKGPLTETTYLDALAKARKSMREDGIDAAVTKRRVDALIAPTGPGAWMVDTINGDFAPPWFTTTPAAVAGYPHITVPMGYVKDVLPVGLSFFSRAWAESSLIKLAFAFERATKHRRSPTFKPSTTSLQI